jgi:hypothetical protein
MSLNDSRIKTKQHFEMNQGRTYALNLQLVRRLPEQYFFNVDHGVFIETKNWMRKFFAVFEAFPEVGLLGARADDGFLPQLVPRSKDAVSYLELCGNITDVERSYIPGYCLGLRPSVIKEIGYYCEENYFEEIDLTYRVCNHTEFKAGFVTDVHIKLPKTAECSQCGWFGKCTLDKTNASCFSKYDTYHKNETFFRNYKWRFNETMRDMQSGARPVYCASILDGASVKDHVYNKDWAMDNIVYFVRNAN